MDLSLAPSVSGAASQITIHAERFRSSLYDRILDRSVDFPGRIWQCIFLAAGQLTRLSDSGERSFPAPAILWEPKDQSLRIRAQAGSHGITLIIGETMLANAIGHKPEAAALRMLTARGFSLQFSTNPGVRDSVETCLATVLQEQDGNQTGKETIIEAQIRIMLVLLWRAGVDAAVSDSSVTPASLTLERFRHLVEAHLRDRWPVGRFAAELGISSDRLHDICTRTLGTPPQKLVQDRTAREAQALLQRSRQTLDQIADYLGFRSTAQFSAFFKKQTGMPPGAFRKLTGEMGKSANLPQSRSYADWP